MVIPNPLPDSEPEPDIRSHQYGNTSQPQPVATGGPGGGTHPPSPASVVIRRASAPSTIIEDDGGEVTTDPTPWQSFKNMLRCQPALFACPVILPIAWALHFSHQNAIAVFITSLLAIIPLAGGLSFATEELATRIGDAWGGLLNATFGNAVELLVAILALVKGDLDIVQASMAGSILSNILLVLGMSYFAGGLRFHEQLYGVVGAQTNISLLSITVAAVLLPEAYHLAFPDSTRGSGSARSSAAQLSPEELSTILAMSRGLSFILLFVYGVYLTFQLYTHAYLFKTVREAAHALPPPNHAHVFPRPNWVASLRTVPTRDTYQAGDGTSPRPGSPIVRAPTEVDGDLSNRASFAAIQGSHSDLGIATARARSGSAPDAHAGHTHLQNLALPDADLRWREKRPDMDVDSTGSPVSSLQAMNTLVDVERGHGPAVHQRLVLPHPEPKVGKVFALVSLAVFTGLAGLTAECLVSSIDGLTEETNVSREFVGLILLPVIGNSVEHITAVTVSLKDRLNLSLSIAVGSSIQVSLCLLPLLVLLGWAIGQPMSLLFDTFETICLVVGIIIVNFAITDGRTNYLEGAVLMAAYVCIALVCWFYDPVH